MRGRPLVALSCAFIALACATTPAVQPTEPADIVHATVSVRLTEASDAAEPSGAASQAPLSDAQLVVIFDSGGREVHPLGSVQGVCSHGPSSDDALVFVRCWWAGVDSALYVRRLGSELVVQQESPSGHEERARVAFDPAVRVRGLGPGS